MTTSSSTLGNSFDQSLQNGLIPAILNQPIFDGASLNDLIQKFGPLAAIAGGIENALFKNTAEIQSGDLSVQEIGNLILAELGLKDDQTTTTPDEFLYSGVYYTSENTSVEYQIRASGNLDFTNLETWNLNFEYQVSGTTSIPIDENFGMSEGFADFNLSGSPGFNWSATAALSIGQDDKGFYFDTGTTGTGSSATDNTTLSLSLGGDLGGMTGVVNIGTLQFIAEDASPDDDIRVTFDAPVKDKTGDGKLHWSELADEIILQPEFDLETALNLGLTISEEWGWLPKFSGNLLFDWKASDPKNPSVEFRDLKLDMADLFGAGGTIQTILKGIRGVLDVVAPVTKTLTAEIPTLTEMQLPDTILEIAAEAGVLDQSTQQFLEYVAKVVDVFDAIPIDAEGNFSIGSIKLAGDDNVFDKGFNLSQSKPYKLLLEAPPSETQALEAEQYSNFANATARFLGETSLTAALGITPAQALTLQGAGITLDNIQNKSASDLSSLLNITPSAASTILANARSNESSNVQFNIPLLEEPLVVIGGFLLGMDMDLFNFETPEVRLDANIAQTFPIYGPIAVRLAGEVGVKAKIGGGYDTRGISEMIGGFINDESVGKNILSLTNGLYLNTAQTYFGIDAALELTAGVDAGIAAVYAGGGVYGDLTVGLNDPNGDGRLRFLEAGEAILDNPLGFLDLFAISGALSARAFVEGSIGWGAVKIKKRFDFVSVTMIAYDPGVGFYGPEVTWLPPSRTRTAAAQIVSETQSIYGQSVYQVQKSGSSKNSVDETNALVLSGAGSHKWRGDVDDQTFMVGRGGVDTVHGGGGYDVVSHLYAEAAVHLNLRTNKHSGAPAQGDSYTGVEQFEGSQFHDTLEGGKAGEALVGNDGDDFIHGGDGDDALEGGLGADTLIGGRGVDYALYWNSPEAVYIDLGIGSLSGGEAEGDLLVGIDNIVGSEHNDTILGSLSQNELFGYRGDDLVDGREGNDTIEGGRGADTLQGGGGIDAVAYVHSSAAVIIDLGTGGAQGGHAAGDQISDFENVIGSNHNDLLSGDALGNILYGSHGNDSLRGRGGADLLIGGQGEDWALYDDATGPMIVHLTRSSGAGGDAEGDDLIEIEHLAGSRFDDILIGNAQNNILQGGTGADSLAGASGIDTADYSNSSGAVEVSLLTGLGFQGDAQGDRLMQIENLTGSTLGDTLQGSKVRNFLAGLSGADQIDGQDGDDTLHGGAGPDSLNGGKGADWAVYSDSQTGVSVRLQNPAQSGGDAEGDVLTEIEHVAGSAYADLLAGNERPNHLFGAEGDDTLVAVGKKDTLSGGTGDDRYEVDSTAVVLRESNSAGLDTVVSSVSWKLGLFFENLELAGSAIEGHGNGASNTISGNNLDNLLFGLGGNDSLSGGDGNDTLLGAAHSRSSTAEIDTLTGGEGSDTFVLGRRGSPFYTGKSGGIEGRSSYALITDFAPDGDRLLLAGSLNRYNLVEKSPGNYELFESLQNDLVAVIRSPSALTIENTIVKAAFV